MVGLLQGAEHSFWVDDTLFSFVLEIPLLKSFGKASKYQVLLADLVSAFRCAFVHDCEACKVLARSSIFRALRLQQRIFQRTYSDVSDMIFPAEMEWLLLHIVAFDH